LSGLSLVFGVTALVSSILFFTIVTSVTYRK
jgi:hypothetical protein